MYFNCYRYLFYKGPKMFPVVPVELFNENTKLYIMTKKKWICDICSKEIESEIEPAKCPCGSKQIEEKEVKSRLERLLEKIF